MPVTVQCPLALVADRRRLPGADHDHRHGCRHGRTGDRSADGICFELPEPGTASVAPRRGRAGGHGVDRFRRDRRGQPLGAGARHWRSCVLRHGQTHQSARVWRRSAHAATGGLRPFTAVDEEGGRVQRLAPVLGRIPSARQMAATMSPAAVRDLAARHAAGMRRLGFDVDLAPDMDVTSALTGVIGDRSFSGNATTASVYGRAFAAGLADGGVLATAKHFPGHGHASGDSHIEPVTTPPLAQLERSDLIPFRDAVSAFIPMIMVGHLTVPDLTHGLPASLSPDAVTGLLRNQYGYDGLVISDSLGMVSVTVVEPDLGAAAVRTLRAGVDVALLPDGADPAPVIDRIVASVESGALPRADLDRAVRHVVAAKAIEGDRGRAWILAGAASQDFLGRPATAAETSCWIAQLASGLVPRATFTRELSLSAEWVGRNVDERYEQALHRQPTASERAYWIGAIARRPPIPHRAHVGTVRIQ